MTRSEQLFAAAQKVMPGGVNSPVRACRSVGTDPRFLARGKGCRVWDVDGNEYIVYGEPVFASVYEIALYYNGEDLSEEDMKEIQNIIDKATDMSPDLGFDAGMLYN